MIAERQGKRARITPSAVMKKDWYFALATLEQIAAVTRCTSTQEPHGDISATCASRAAVC